MRSAAPCVRIGEPGLHCRCPPNIESKLTPAGRWRISPQNCVLHSTPASAVGNPSAFGASACCQANRRPAPADLNSLHWLPTSIPEIGKTALHGFRTRRPGHAATPPSASIHKSSYPYAVDQAQHQKGRPDTGSAIAHQRERNAGDRHPSHNHSYVHQYMK